MSEKILKDITKYDGSEKFQYFRETLVDEVSENFNILENKILTYDENNKNLHLIFQNNTINTTVNNYVKKLQLDSALSKEIINNYNSVYIKVDVNN